MGLHFLFFAIKATIVSWRWFGEEKLDLEQLCEVRKIQMTRALRQQGVV